MKKFLDRYLFSRLGVQIFVSVLVIALFAVLATYSRNALLTPHDDGRYQQIMWGFKQVSSTGAAIGTIESLDKIAAEARNPSAAPLMLILSLSAWLVGLVVYSFVTGAIVNAYRNRKANIDAGMIRYKFKGHGIIIGWDFQGVASVMALFDIYGAKEVVVLSSQSPGDIRAELSAELGPSEMNKIFFYRGSVSVEEDLESLYAWRAKAIIVLGDLNDTANDPSNARTETLLRDNIESHIDAYLPKNAKDVRLSKWPQPFPWLVSRFYAYQYAHRVPKSPIQCFIDISDDYNLLMNEMQPDGDAGLSDYLDVHILNFSRASVREALSSFKRIQNYNIGREKGNYSAVFWPMMFRLNPEASHAHIVISGFNATAREIVRQTATILPVGSVPSHITVFSSDAFEIDRFRSLYPLTSLLNVKIDFVNGEIGSASCRNRLIEICRDISASVTLFITDDNPNDALATFNRIPPELRYENFHIMIEQRMLSKWLQPIAPLQTLGFSSIEYFGMTDRFHYSLASQDSLAMACFGDEKGLPGDKIHEEWNHAISNGDMKQQWASYVSSLLERLYSVGLAFDYCPANVPEIHFTTTDIDRLMQSEHIRNVNNLLLTGHNASVERGMGFKSVIRPWESVDPETKAGYRKRIEHMITIINRTFCNGLYPYAVVKRDYRHILGVLPCDITALAPSARSILSFTVHDSILEPSQEHGKVFIRQDGEKRMKAFAAPAILLVPEPGFVYGMFNAAYFDGMPIIAVLPCPCEKFEARFPEGKRRRVRRIIRNAQAYYVLDPEPRPEEEATAILEFICAHVNQVVTMDKREMPTKITLGHQRPFPSLPLREAEVLRIDVTTEKDRRFVVTHEKIG